MPAAGKLLLTSNWQQVCACMPAAAQCQSDAAAQCHWHSRRVRDVMSTHAKVSQQAQQSTRDALD